jgi:RNA polymerase sigma factor (sigma-70 family)
MRPIRQDLVAWVGSEILPHEADVRAWLRRLVPTLVDVDDVVQEAYARIVALDTVGHIQNGRAYLFRTVRNVALEQIRRSRIVRIDTVADIASIVIADDAPSTERIVAGRQELQHVQALIAGLPRECRRIFELRRIHGVPQRQIALQLGVSENTVELQAVRGLKLILKALAGERDDFHPVRGATHEPSRELSPGRRSGQHLGHKDRRRRTRAE